MPDTTTPETAAAPYRRFTLLPDGVIACQTQDNNPLPGPSVARLMPGPHWTRPDFSLIVDSLPQLGIQPTEMEAALRAWLPTYISETLPFLTEDEAAPEIVKPLLAAVAEQGGIAERAKLSMPELDPAARFYLRQKGMRLGPVHLYYQSLLKPAPLTLRALLWATHKGLAHPLPYPRPGVTSYSWPPEITPDAEVQHWFGYPLYARRACRVDRIDKIVCDVYESAAKGVFAVKHAYAEWLGCKVEDICALLTELGHTRITPPPANEEPGTEAAKATIEFRLKSDRPAREARPERKPREERGERRSKGDTAERRHVKPFKKSVNQRHDRNERSVRPAKDAPMTGNPFANLKDMLGG